MKLAWIAGLFALSAVAVAQAEVTPTPPLQDHRLLTTLAHAVQPADLKLILTKLVSFGTRHTLSTTTSPPL